MDGNPLFYLNYCSIYGQYFFETVANGRIWCRQKEKKCIRGYPSSMSNQSFPRFVALSKLT
jgi:hypothetical protein